MKKHIIYLFILSFGILAAQSSIDVLSVDDPITVPISPEASKLGSYGNLSLQSATGNMSLSVPIYEISNPMGKWPINLSYAYSGLKLEQDPSVFGLGWTFTANGVVNREIRGLPDEEEFGYYGNSYVRNQIYQYMDHGIDVLSLNDIRKFNKGEFDGEADKYTVNVGGLNFSFKIGLDGSPVFLSKHAHKVAIIWDTPFIHETHEINGFIVTDTSGIKYRFEAIEKSIPYIDEEVLLNARVSWNLTKIIYPDNREITFEYVPDTYINHSFDAKGVTLFADIVEDAISEPVYVNPAYGESYSTSTIERKLLSKIIFNQGEIEFITNIISGRTLYESISVKDNHGNTITEYDFTYQGNRDNLIKINKNLQSYYEFEYFTSTHEDIPNFYNSITNKPLSQDWYGYYNGAGNNYLVSVPNSSYTANRAPSLTHTRLGALKSITYPTGGTSEIDYELHQLKKDVNSNVSDYTFMPVEKRIEINGDSWNYGDSQYLEQSFTRTFPYPAVVKLGHSITGGDIYSEINMSIGRVNSDGTILPVNPCPYGEFYPSGFNRPVPYNTETANYHNYYTTLSDAVELYNAAHPDSNLVSDLPYMCPELAVAYFPADFDLNVHATNVSRTFIIMPGTYKFKLWTSRASSLTATGAITLRMQEGWDSPPPEFANYDTPGIRVASIKDCANNDDNSCVARTFNYNDTDGFSSGKSFTPSKNPFKIARTVTDISGVTTYSETHIFHAKPYSKYSSFIGSPIYYSSITERKETGNGYIQTKYDRPNESTFIVYPDIPRGRDLSKGVLEVINIFKEDNTIVEKNQSEFQIVRGLYEAGTTSDINTNHPVSIKIKPKSNRIVDFSSFNYDLNPINPIDINAIKELYVVKDYKELDTWKKKIEQVNTSFYEGDMSIINQTNLSYDSYQNIIKETNLLADGNTLEKNYQYSYDISDPIYNLMVTKNQIDSPVMTNSKYNGDLISQRKTSFVNVGSGYKPASISTAKGSTSLENRIHFEYDSWGNVIEVKKEGDIPVTYIWGYENSLLIAKLENIAHIDISAAIITNLKNLSNLDIDATSEDNLRTALNVLRASFPNAMVSTYTYDPLVGVTSVTDVKGYTSYFEYDDKNRLKAVKDAEGNMLSKNEYNYRIND